MQFTSSPTRSIPGWVKLGAAGLGILAVTQWVPTGLTAIFVVVGALLILVALTWGRVWVTQLVPREQRPLAWRRSSEKGE